RSVHLEKGSCYQLSFWMYLVNSSSTVSFEIRDVSSDALLNTYTLPWMGTEDVWTQFSYNFQIPAGCSSSDVKIVLRNGLANNGGNDYYIDDISLTKLGSCSAPLITTCPTGFLPVDTDGDGVLDSTDLDDDNDGILDTTECSSSQRITNASFIDEGSGGNIVSVPNWTLSGGTLYADSTGMQFENNNTTQTLSQNVTNFYPDVNGKKIINVSFISMTGSPILNSDSIQFTIRYNGVDYARIETVRELTSTSATAATITYLNGATGNLVSPIPHDNRVAPAEAIQNLQLSIPYTTPSSGSLSFFFNSSVVATGNTLVNVNDDDILLVSVGINSCSDFDGDTIPNFLDLDSDGDGCSDANEYYASTTADGNDGGVFGVGTPTVDANGRVTGPVAASYAGTYTLSTGTSSVLDATTPIDRTIAAGSNTTFAVTVTTAGSATTNHQWQVSTDNGSTWTNIVNGGVYSTATTATLTITGATVGMNSYKYRDLVSQSNKVCPVISRVANLCIIPAIPTISSVAATCSAAGTSTISNYYVSNTYTFNPATAGISFNGSGLISGMTLGTSYTVTSGNGTCTSAASASFSNAVMLSTPSLPTLTIAQPSCGVSGTLTITNYNAAT
ncbi:MAG: hypothetical protein HGA35_06150, partial [Erysipelotrichaceae bacterium]|nr:hypothetical protein [Erysipelotrichaceae bacterium]